MIHSGVSEDDIAVTGEIKDRPVKKTKIQPPPSLGELGWISRWIAKNYPSLPMRYRLVLRTVFMLSIFMIPFLGILVRQIVVEGFSESIDFLGATLGLFLFLGFIVMREQ